MARAPHVLIAGAGIGGLVTTLALTRIGATVTLLERAPALLEIGAGLQISPNAGRELARLDLLDAVAAVASRPAGVRVRAAATARDVAYISFDDAERRWGAPYLVARRADLLRVLAANASNEPSVTLHLGTAVAGYGTHDAAVTVTAKQGALTRTFRGDALIGADGVRSSVRARLVDADDDAPRETGRTAWRTLLPLDAAPASLRPLETGLWLGRDAHLVHYPLPGGWLNVVAVTRDTLPLRPESLWAQPGDPALIRRRFARWHRSACALIDAAPSWTTWPLFDRAPLTAWNAGPVALLGDAAHPILPFLAQGAAQAIEDAGALASALAATREIPDALAAYSRTRRDRAMRVQDASRQLGRVYHLAGPAAVARDTAMRLAGPRRLAARYDWLYGGAPTRPTPVTRVTGPERTA